MNRRKLLHAGVLASTAGFTGASSLLNPAYSATNSNKILVLDHFIFDERFSDSLHAASFFKQTSVIKHAVSGDLTDLWYQHLDTAWKQGPTTVAGITTESALFYLRRLAWIHQVRLIYQGYHPVPINNKVQHSFKGGKKLISSIANMNGLPWPSGLGMALTQNDAYLLAQEQTEISINLAEPEYPKLEPRDTILVSWILAPFAAST